MSKTTKQRLRLVVVLYFITLTSAITLHAQPVVEYLGNEGVRVELGEVSLLFDPLWDNDYGRYENVPADLLAEIREASGRFGEVDYLLVSHRHGDHFAADMVAGYLTKNSNCTFIASAEVVDLLRKSSSWSPGLEEQVIEVDLELGESLRVLNVDHGSIDATWVLHGGEQNKDIVNLAFRVETDAGSVLHTGDADAATAKSFLAQASADIALVAFWQFVIPEGEGTVDGSPGIEQFIAFHVPVDSTRIEVAFEGMSNVVLLNEPGEIFRP